MERGRVLEEGGFLGLFQHFSNKNIEIIIWYLMFMFKGICLK